MWEESTPGREQVKSQVPRHGEAWCVPEWLEHRDSGRTRNRMRSQRGTGPRSGRAVAASVRSLDVESNGKPLEGFKQGNDVV